MAFPRPIRNWTDKATRLKLDDVLRYAKSIKRENQTVYEAAGAYLHESYPRGCEVYYLGGLNFVGGSPKDIAIALMWMKVSLDRISLKGVSKNARTRIRYTEEELKFLKSKKKRKAK